jgi:hypothetical protein
LTAASAFHGGGFFVALYNLLIDLLLTNVLLKNLADEQSDETLAVVPACHRGVRD